MMKKLYLMAVVTMVVGSLSANEGPKSQEKGGGKIWWCNDTYGCKRCPKPPCDIQDSDGLPQAKKEHKHLKNTCSSLPKLYFASNEIEINESRIFLTLDNKKVETDTLHSDQGGIYVHQNHIRCVACRRPIDTKLVCNNPLCSSFNQ